MLLFVFHCVYFLSDSLTLRLIIFTKLNPHYFVNHEEYGLQNFKGVLLLLEAFTYQDLGPKEARIFVVNHLVCDVTFDQARAVKTENITDVFVYYLVSGFFRLSEHNKMITSLEFFGFLLVLRRAWHWEVIGFDLGHELLEMLVCLHARTDL